MGKSILPILYRIWQPENGSLLQLFTEMHRQGNLGTYIDTFLENWVGDNPKYDGRYVRKALPFKDAWSLDANNAWQKVNKQKL